MSIEFILLIVITLVYIYGTVWPLINDAIFAAEDVQRVSDTKIAAQKLANAVNEAAAGSGESKRTIHLLVPAGASIECDSANKKINYAVDVNNLHERNPLAKDPTGIGCERKALVPTPANFKCTSSIALLESINCTTLQGPLFKAIVITKNSAGVITVG